MLAQRWERDVGQIGGDNPYRKHAVVSGCQEAPVLGIDSDSHLPVAVTGLVLHLLDQAANGRAVRHDLEAAGVMDMRQWVGAACRGARQPCGSPGGPAEYPGGAEQDVQQSSPRGEEHSDRNHKLHPGKPVSVGVVGTCCVVRRLALIGPGGAHRRCPIWITVV